MKKYIFSMLFVFIATIGSSQNSLSSADEQSLLYMLEEEKLERIAEPGIFQEG